MIPPEPHALPDADEMLAQLAQEGREDRVAPERVAERVPERPFAIGVYGQELADSTARQRAKVVLQATTGNYKGIKRCRYSHLDCIDRMLQNPTITTTELAEIYEVTASWISIVINCDAFKVAYADRKAELINPALTATLNERYGALAAKSVEVLLEKLHRPIEQVSDKLALEAAALGARTMGVGEQKSPGVAAADHLAALAHRLIDLNRPAGQVVEGETRIIEGD